MRFYLLKISFLFFILTSCSNSEAQFRPSKIFGEHMVLQRNEPLKIWGWGSAGKKIILNFRGKSEQKEVDENGFWEFNLPPQVKGGPYVMTIASARKKFEWKDIYIGDVWVCSGQSNMEWALKDTDHAQEEISLAKDSLIRHFKVPRTSEDVPAKDLGGGEWQNASVTTVGDFTAVGYYFAKKIRSAESDLAIGLINSTWGGSRIEPWISAESQGLKNLDEFLKKIKNKRALDMAQLDKILVSNFPGFFRAENRNNKKKVDWEKIDIDDSHWPTMTINGNWENEGFEQLDGVLWYRKTFELTKSEAGRDYTLNLGMIDDSDWTYVNGKLIGEMSMSYNVNRSYKVEKGLLKAGRNVIAVRVEDTGGGGGINAEKGRLGLKSSSDFIDLFDDWKIHLELQYPFTDYSRNAVPTVLYNKMIFPIVNFPVKGVLWYQGESNADQTREEYADLFKGLIKNWRADWKKKNLPFYFVQLAAFTEAPTEPEYSSWPNIRMAQSDALSLNNTGMAVTIDIGDAEDIHPRNKRDVGERLALNALKNEYGKKVNHRGPNPKSISIFEENILIEYNHADGLFFKNNNLSEKQFSVAGANGKYYWAKPTLSNGRILLKCPEVKEPVEVRYAWAANPQEASLYNSDKLPAEPFTMKVSQ